MFGSIVGVPPICVTLDGDVGGKGDDVGLGVGPGRVVGFVHVDRMLLHRSGRAASDKNHDEIGSGAAFFIGKLGNGCNYHGCGSSINSIFQFYNR